MIRILLALVATLITGVQSLLIYANGKGVCFNNGCEIVESLTTVPPLYFNLVGCLFFFTIFLCLLLARNGSDYWLRFARILLLAGLMGEAVLVFFQYKIANVFCSYCLIVLTCVVLLNLLCGPRQIFRGVILFSAVFVACLSLQFNGGGAGHKGLPAGALAVYDGEEGRPQLTLFFSSTCAHCERVIDSLREESSCSISFNPVEEIESFNFEGARVSEEYDPGINLGFLTSLGLSEIPVMLVRDGEDIRVLRGGLQINGFIDENCKVQEEAETSDLSGVSALPQNGYSSYLPTDVLQDDNCRVEADCEEEPQAVQQSAN